MVHTVRFGPTAQIKTVSSDCLKQYRRTTSQVWFSEVRSQNAAGSIEYRNTYRLKKKFQRLSNYQRLLTSAIIYYFHNNCGMKAYYYFLC